MKISGDSEGLQAVIVLCDIALKTQGVKVLDFVTKVRAAVTPVEEDSDENTS